MFWFILLAVLVGFALCWWRSGHAKLDTRKRRIETDVAINAAKSVPYMNRGGGIGTRII